ncbi:MAG: hypothetical protein NTY67_09725 [Cyanobacteria bacterium]|nr:hypothetical protein [Cyanobacteriota bacterium]
MANIAGKAYGINVITPLRHSWLNRLIFALMRARPLAMQPLRQLRFIHFARWLILPRHLWPGLAGPHQWPAHDYLLFISNFNGSWDQYIDAFSDGFPAGLDWTWYGAIGYPGSVPITPFKTYIAHNQIDCGYYYNSTPGSAQRDIRSALRVWAAIDRLALAYDQLGPDEDQAFARLYARVTGAIANNLPASGPAPLASIDSDAANRHRRALRLDSSAAGGISQPPSGA